MGASTSGNVIRVEGGRLFVNGVEIPGARLIASDGRRAVVSIPVSQLATEEAPAAAEPVKRYEL